MRSPRRLHRTLSLLAALVLPALALGQGQVAPGAASGAWPLGIIVAAVVFFAVATMLGAYAASQRRERTGGGGPPAHR